jgi:Flp pilus assembly protein CpaB
MSTARIVVLIIALSAVGVASCLARDVDKNSFPTEPVAPLQTARILVAADLVERGPHEHAPKRGASINVARYGITSPSTAQK